MKFYARCLKFPSWVAAWLLFFHLGAHAEADIYNPLDLGNAAPPAEVDLNVHDAARNRDIPLHAFIPNGSQAAPVILLSPGLGGSFENYSYLSKQWAARGYVVISLQHPGSDASIWKDKPKEQAVDAMKTAASLDNFLLRVKDVPAVLDQLDLWNKLPGHVLYGRLDLNKVGMSGHSFGALTTQAVSGESLGRMGAIFTDPRIKAALAMSPSPPRRGDPATAFGSIQIPWMLMTGTNDNSPLSDTNAASRRTVYPYLHGAPKYQVVLDKAEHSAFTDRSLPGDAQPRNPNHHRVILALSTAFWDACLRDDKAANAWLTGTGPRSVMEAADQWQFDLGTGPTASSSPPGQ
jgi:predicted dienelactone hydrolase